MDITVYPARPDGAVRAVPSKSQAHRALICAALADGPTRIGCEGDSEDIAATAACLSALGAQIARSPGGFDVRPMSRAPVSTGDTAAAAVSLPCAESGSTFRFMLPIVCALARRAAFLPRGRLPRRPLSPLYEELVRHGCELSPQGSVPFLAAGRLTPGRYELDAGVSSQFVSGLLFALPLLSGNSELYLSGRMESAPYVRLTTDMLKLFGIEARFDGTVFSVPGNQVYRSPDAVDVEGDWSNAAFWLGAGAVGAGSVTCTGLDARSPQGDRAVADILRRFGARVESHTAGAERGASICSVAASGGTLGGVEIDARDIPDLVPILAVVGAAARGTTVIRNAGRLRAKESDRLAAVTAVLRALGADAEETADGLVIRGGRVLTGGDVDAFGDHRIAMAAAVAATVCSGPVVIRGAEAVAKSYPGFFDDLRALGGVWKGGY